MPTHTATEIQRSERATTGEFVIPKPALFPETIALRALVRRQTRRALRKERMERERQVEKAAARERQVEKAAARERRAARALAVQLNRNTPRSSRAKSSVVDPLNSDPPSEEEDEYRADDEEADSPPGGVVQQEPVEDDEEEAEDLAFSSIEIEASASPFSPESPPHAEKPLVIQAVAIPAPSPLDLVVETVVVEETFGVDGQGNRVLVKRVSTTTHRSEASASLGKRKAVAKVAGRAKKSQPAKEDSVISAGDFVRRSDRKPKPVHQDLKDLSRSEGSDDEENVVLIKHKAAVRAPAMDAMEKDAADALIKLATSP